MANAPRACGFPEFRRSTRASAWLATKRIESLVERGFRTFLQGVAMQRPNDEGFNRSGVYVIDDWR